MSNELIENSKKIFDEVMSNLGKDVDLVEKLTKSGVLVSLSANRYRGFQLPKNSLKYDNSNDESVNFVNEYVKSGSISILNRYWEDKLLRVEGKARMRLQRVDNASQKTTGTGKGRSNNLTLKGTGKFLFIDDFKVFYNEFLKYQEEYNEILAQIQSSWDDIILNFKPRAVRILREMGVSNDEINGFISKIPTVSQYSAKFKMSLKVLPIVPPSANIDLGDELLNNLIIESTEDEAVKALMKIVTVIVSKLFDSCEKALESCSKNERLTASTLKTLQTSIKSAQERNKDYLNFSEINDICDSLLQDEVTDSDIEAGLINTYIFARNKCIESYLIINDSSVYNRDFFELMYNNSKDTQEDDM